MNKNILKKLILWSLVILAVLAVVIQSFFKESTSNLEPKMKISGSAPPKINVNGVVVQFTNVTKSVFASGTLLGDESVELKSEISGRIIKMNLNEGSKVSKGDLLLKLNDNDLIAQLNKAKERLKLLELTESRQRQLYEKQGISRQDYDIAVSEFATQKAEIEYLKAMIERTEIRSPFNGVIGLRYISEGAYITPATEIASLQKIDYLKIDFSVPQKYFNKIQKGSSLTFRVPPDSKEYKVDVYAIEPKIDELTRTFRLRGKFSNYGKNLIPGSYAEVDIVTDDNPNSIMIPSIALMPDLESEFVFVSVGGKAVKKNVRTGTRNTEQIEIVSGLNPGDTLLTSGLMQIRTGSEVIVTITNIGGDNK